MLSSNKGIEERLVHALDILVDHSKKGLSSFDLAFEDTGEDFGLNAYWNHKDKAWDCGSDIDPLSALLLAENAEREDVKDKQMDNETLVSVAHLINRSRSWIWSFQDGWYDRSNSGSSITGWILGHRLRVKYLASNEK